MEIIISSVVICVGTVAIYIGFRHLKLFHTGVWQVTEGQVTVSEVRKSPFGEVQMYIPFVSYSYSVNEKNYNSHWITLGAGLTPDIQKSKAELTLKEWPIGKKVRVFFVPDGDSYIACLDPKNPTWMSYVTVLTGLVSVVAGIVLLVYTYL